MSFVDRDVIPAAVRRTDLTEDAHRFLRIHAATGQVEDVGPVSCWDAYGSLAPIGAGRFLLVPYNQDWLVVDDRGAKVIEGPTAAAGASVALLLALERTA